MPGKAYYQSIDARCGTTHNMTALSTFSATSSGVLMLFTIPLNAVIIYCIFKERKKKYKSLFYKLLLNIAVADLLTGFIADPTAVNALWKEGLRIKLKLYEVYVIHVSLFFTDAVALMTLTVLSIDRIMALMLPIKHHKGMSKRNENIVVICAWPVACILVAPYFKINFIKQLAVFSTVNIVVCILSLIVTTITYKKSLTFFGTSKNKDEKIKRKKKIKDKISHNSTEERDKKLRNQKRPKSASMEMTPISAEEGNIDQMPLNDQSHHPHCDTKSPASIDHRTLVQENSIIIEMPRDESSSDNKTSVQKEKKKTNHSPTKGQKKATRTFILMLCVFVATYLPTCFTMIYMNVCTDCDCVVVHVMRDISILSILSSSVFRPLNFILTLKHLRLSVYRIFVKKKADSMNSSIVVTGS